MDTRTVVRRASTTAIVCAIALAVLYVLAVWTAKGQRFEDAVLSGAAATADAGRASMVGRVGDGVAIWALRTVSTPMVAACTLLVLAIGFVRREPLLAHLGAGVIIASVVTAEVMREFALRPVLLEHGVRRADQSFPSGHTAAAASVLFALILVVPRRARWSVSLVTAPWAPATSVATVTVGWHRPSDAVGSEIVALFYACLAVAVIAGRTRSQRQAVRSPISSGSRVPIALALGMAAYVGVAAFYMSAMLVDRPPVSAAVRASALDAYVAGRITVVVLGFAVMTVFVLLLRHVGSGVSTDQRAVRRPVFASDPAARNPAG
jgi:membrane-associated phospholipid phosphatase